MSEFIRSVGVALQPLTATGTLNWELERYDEHTFGNALVVLRGRSFRVRFVRDRGEVLVELACLSGLEKWHLFQRVLVALNVASPPEGPIEVDVAADLLRRNVDAIEAKMCLSDTASKLRELEAAAARELLESLKQP